MASKVYDHSPLVALWPRELVSLSVLEFQEKMAEVAYSSRMAKCEKAMTLKVILGQVKGEEIAMVWFPFWQHYCLPNVVVTHD